MSGARWLGLVSAGTGHPARRIYSLPEPSTPIPPRLGFGTKSSGRFQHDQTDSTFLRSEPRTPSPYRMGACPAGCLVLASHDPAG